MKVPTEEQQQLSAFILKSLGEKEAQLAERLEMARTGREAIEKEPGAVVYTVILSSLWADKGEQNVRIKGKGSLASLVKRAERRFKKLNNRSDVQATYSAWVLLGNPDNPTVSIKIPENFLHAEPH